MSSTHGNKQKHTSSNPVQRALIAHFLRRVSELVIARSPRHILEIGCGEGFVLRALRDAGVRCPMRGVDFSETAIAEARERVPDAVFEVQDAAKLAADGQRYDVVLMIEVLEHLPDPRRMLGLLGQLAERHVVLSVPWEPFFRGLNFARGKHMRALGNDPEHIQHWSRAEFQRFVGDHFVIQDAPLVFPWTLVGAAVPQ
ncbi:MAG TPA: class I SAM-dependent methyltransferase [Polyangiales bacterium]|nr:class I SAM-dependent methyltransferase [Polyangiales bacterium]